MDWEANWTANLSENRYSRRVALLKRLLPAIGLALLLLISIWPRLAPLWDRMRLGFAAIDLRDARELRMFNPRYLGTDRLNRPYTVTAAVAHQIPDRQDLMSMEAPRADMKTHGGADVVITGATGIYQSQTQLLDLFGDVTLVHQDGTRFVTDTARLDVAHNTAQGDDPVEGHGPSGNVKAQGFRIFDKGDTILFTGRSDMLLRGAKPEANASEPTTLPPTVAATAARVEAEGKPMLAAAAPHPATTKHAAAGHKPAPKTEAHRAVKKDTAAKKPARKKE
ncbi:MAG TPA: LPS export ABC transporter periplasmic protein LptC [Stellaceae bacterium]|nr:LPS export ABC transporter periplasmic protein LptC [Stellaceae bacterium]